MTVADDASIDPIVELFVGPEALRIDVFDEYKIDLSMTEVGTAWSLAFWYSDISPEAPWRVLIDPVRGVKCGHTVTLAFNGEAVLSGIVETRDVGDNPGRATPTFVISGRDALAPALTGDADPTLTLPGLTLEDALDLLYTAVGIRADVSESLPADVRTGVLRRLHRGAHAKKVSRRAQVLAKHPRIGEKIQQVAERIVRSLGYRIWTTPAPDSGRTAVVVDRPRTSGEPLFSLVRVFGAGGRTAESNIENAREATNIREVPTTVTVYANAPRGDAQSAKIARTVTNGFLLTPEASARVADDAPERPRYVESRTARSEEAAHNEASRICAQANEGFRRYMANVLGHRQGGRMWMPNNLVAVRDELVGIDETMLLVAVQFTGARKDGPKTSLTLLPQGALTEIAETP